MTDIIFFLNGEAKKVPSGTALKNVLVNQPEDTSVVILKPASVSKDETTNLRLETTAGDIVLELASGVKFPKTDIENLRVHFEDKNAASFGPFPSDFTPAKETVRYDRGEVCLGCGGYNSKNSYLTFSRREHMGDHGAAEGRAVIGRV
ncbi:MAG: methanogenesis marker 3 protein, partial [Methanocorpusculum sp.]|nr:methanogenesis marker 3 protein [Methanocorpusculum sp.]